MERHFSQTVRIVAFRSLAISAAALTMFMISGRTAVVLAQKIRERSHDIKNGERLYKSGCIACHGANGTGAPQALTEFKRPETFLA